MSNSSVTLWTVTLRLLSMRFFQTRILDWVAISSSRVSSQPRDRTSVFCIFHIGRWITTKPPGKPPRKGFLKVENNWELHNSENPLQHNEVPGEMETRRARLQAGRLVRKSLRIYKAADKWETEQEKALGEGMKKRYWYESYLRRQRHKSVKTKGGQCLQGFCCEWQVH